MFAEQESRLSFLNVLLKSKPKLSAFFTSDGTVPRPLSDCALSTHILAMTDCILTRLILT